MTFLAGETSRVSQGITRGVSTHLVISPLKLLDMGEIDNEDESGSDHGLKLKIGAYLVPSKPFSPQRYPEVVKKLS